MTKTSIRHYQVAGHCFSAGIPELAMHPYEPFARNETNGDIFTLKLGFLEEGQDIGTFQHCFNDEPPYVWIYKDSPVQEAISSTDSISMGFSFTTDRPFAMLYTPKSELQISNGANDCLLLVKRDLPKQSLENAITNAMMSLTAMFATKLDTLMLHASAVMHEGCGYIFLGKSGTGKSTHLQLWLDNIPGCERLNDDNPLVRMIDGRPYVYGTPWSGKTPCYKDKFVPLKGIVKLHQAPFNKIERLELFESYATLFPSCSNIRWRKDLCDSIAKTIESVVTACPVYDLQCLPDADAAFTCFNMIRQR